MADRKSSMPRKRDAKLDPRALRTRESIVEAFVELCGEQGIQTTSVAGIARRAGVNRATFYRHFESKADILERGIETLLAFIFNDIESVAPEGARPDARILMRITRFFEVARDRSRLFGLLVSGAAGRGLREKTETFVEGFLRDKRLKTAGENRLRLPLPLASRVLTSVLFGFTSWWTEHPRSYTAREMAVLCLEATTGGFFKAQSSVHR